MVVNFFIQILSEYFFGEKVRGKKSVKNMQKVAQNQHMKSTMCDFSQSQYGTSGF